MGLAPMSKFKLNFDGMPIAVLSSYMTGAEIQYYRDLGFHTVEQLYATLVTLKELDETTSKALRACQQNLTQEQMDDLVPVSGEYSTGLLLDE